MFLCREEEEGILSSGPGIEREVIYAAYRQFESIPEQWFIPQADNLMSLATSHSMGTAQYVSTSRLSDLSVLGAIVALLLIHGIAPGKLDPVVLQYFVYGCNIASIHPAFLCEWHPDIHDTVTRWIAAGPYGGINFEGLTLSHASRWTPSGVFLESIWTSHKVAAIVHHQ